MEKETNMHINFSMLIHEYNEKKGVIRGVNPISECLTKASLARELVAKGVINEYRSAINLMHFHQHGTMKSVDFKLLEFAKEKFGKSTDEILNAKRQIRKAYCPICHKGDHTSQKIMVCKKCQTKLNKPDNGKIRIN